jgi:hypothetical protein
MYVECPDCKALNKTGAQSCRQCGGVIHPAAPPVPANASGGPGTRAAQPQRESPPTTRRVKLINKSEPRQRSPRPNWSNLAANQVPGWAGPDHPQLRAWLSRPEVNADATLRFGGKLCKPLWVLVLFGRNGLPADCRLLSSPITTFGREEGEVLLIQDAAVSARHAQLRYRDDLNLVLSDLGSTNGTFYRLRAGQSYRLWDGCRVLAGQQAFRYQPHSIGPAEPSRKQTMPLNVAPGSNIFACLKSETDGRELLLGERTVLGRSAAKSGLAIPDDPFLSPAHAVFEYLVRFQQLAVQDLGSFNGTFVQLRQEIVLEDGDQFRLGEQLFGVVQARTD